MSGAAGSKYGIINDEIPLKKNQSGRGDNNNAIDRELKDIQPIIRERSQSKKGFQIKPN